MTIPTGTTGTAFVTGANGYIAQHLIKLLLSKNHKVVGSVRTKEKGENLRSLFPSGFEYEVVPNLKEGSFDEALKRHPDITVFYHNASPVFYESNDFQVDIIDPAIEGTKSALEAVEKYSKNLKKFVLTSSIAAIVATSKPDAVITEDTWAEFTKESSVANGRAAYAASKTFGEKVGWDYIKEKKPTFDFVSVNPYYVFGPQAFDSEVKPQLNITAEFLNQILKLKPTDSVPEVSGSAIDVRDVALAHFIAGENDEIKNERLLLQHTLFTGHTIANIVHKNFPELNGKIVKGDPSDVPSGRNIDDSKTLKILGIELISLEQTIVDAAKQILAANK